MWRRLRVEPWRRPPSSSIQNYPPKAAIDGDRTGRLWGSGGGWNDKSQGIYSTDRLRINFAGSRKSTSIRSGRTPSPTQNPDPTINETFNNADTGNGGIVDFDVQYLSNNGWKTVPGGRVIGNDKVWRKFTFNSISTTAIRVAVHKSVVWTNVPNNFSRILEIEAYDASNINVARQTGAAVVASSEHHSGNFPASSVTDGDRRGFNWGSGGYGSGWNDNTENVFASDWLQVDFGSNRTIEEVDVFTCRITSLRVSSRHRPKPFRRLTIRVTGSPISRCSIGTAPAGKRFPTGLLQITVTCGAS
jgi:hypothetical protein